MLKDTSSSAFLSVLDLLQSFCDRLPLAKVRVVVPPQDFCQVGRTGAFYFRSCPLEAALKDF